MTKCGKQYSQLLPNYVATAGEPFSPLQQINFITSVKGTDVFQCEFNRTNNTYDKYSEFVNLRTSFNGKQNLPITQVGNEIYLLSTVSFSGKKIQFVMFDMKNMSESQIENTLGDMDQAIANINQNKYDIVHFDKTNYDADTETYINAYYCIIKYHEFLSNMFNRAGLIDSSHVIPSFVNVKFTNAFWYYFCMVFGNAKDNPTGRIKPLTSMDVCCHELTHGLISNTVDLEYRGESGALNESIADIFGTFLEFYVNCPEDAPDWTMGEQFNYIIRSFENPKKYQQPTTYKGEYWANTSDENNDNGGVHTNSGVTNYCCYLSVVGNGTYVNDAGKKVDLSIMPCVNYNDFIKLLFAMLSNKKITTTCTFKQFAEALLNIAEDIKIKNRLQLCAYAVNICDAPPSPTPPSPPPTPPPTPPVVQNIRFPVKIYSVGLGKFVYYGTFTNSNITNVILRIYCPYATTQNDTISLVINRQQQQKTQIMRGDMKYDFKCELTSNSIVEVYVQLYGQKYINLMESYYTKKLIK